MAVYQSPGVFTNEQDQSAFATLSSDLVAAFVGTSNKGPLNKAVFITTAQQFVETYGEPFPDSYLGYAVLAYLEQGNACYVNRVGVECEDGQDSSLDDICIDTSGNNTTGWGRIPVFTGTAYGKICTRVVDADNPAVFHAASTSTPEFFDINESSTDGPTTASMALSGSYTDAIDDSFIVVITDAPVTSSAAVLDGATYDVIRNSDGATIDSGTLNDSGFTGVSDSFTIGTGDDDTGLTAVITVSGSSPLETGDYFIFTAAPDNRIFSFSVEGDVPDNILISGTYTTATSLADQINSLAGSSEEYVASAQDDNTVCIMTDDAGKWIQLTGSEAFALELGLQKWTYNIPRSYIVGTGVGPYNINTNNNRVKFRVESVIDGTLTSEVTLTVGSHTSADLVTSLDVAGTIDGTQYFDVVELQISDDDTVPLAITTLSNTTDNIGLVANSSNIKTLRFAQELDIVSPYGVNYTVFNDTRAILPEQSASDPATPASGLADDIAYYAAIVGFIVAESAGTWSDNFSVSLSVFNNTVGRYTLKIIDSHNTVVDRLDDVSFDSSDTRYIANLINEGSTLGGTNGNKYIRWEERPAELNNDPTDTSSFEIRNPGSFRKSFVGGANGIPTDAVFSSLVDAAIIGNAAENTGIWVFQNPDVINIDLLITPGVSTGAVIGEAISLCEERNDCMYLVDPPFGLKPQQVVDWHNGILDSTLTTSINSSYAALYWSWQKVFDQFSGSEIFIPPSGQVAAVYARTARVGEKWFAPAGLNRGRLLTSLDVEYNPTRGERDLLYGFGNAVNPIVDFPQDGIVVFGQRTLQRADTALNRVNVRMLLNTLKRTLSRVLRNFLFEPNDRFLWATVQSTIEPLLRDVAARRGLSGYKVQVDENNNTPERMDRNELWVTVMIKPTKAAEFIVLNIAVLRSDASFSAEESLSAGGVTFTQ